MKHLRLLSVVFLICLWSCAPRYGAHFQKTSDEARFYSTHTAQKIVSAPEALASIAPDGVKREMPLAEPAPAASDKELMDKLLALQRRQNKGNISEKKVQKKKEALVLEAVRSKLGSMSPDEKKAFRKSVRQAKSDIREKATANHAPAAVASGMDVSESTLLLVLITILIPPLGVYLYEDEINEKFWIALVLTLLFYVPGLIYSLIVILD